MADRNFVLTRITAVLLLSSLFTVYASAAQKSSTQIPSIQAPAQPPAAKSPGQVPSIQAPTQPAAPAQAPAGQPAAAQAPAAGVPVMVPVAASQRELSPEIQKNLKLLTGQNFPLEARQIGAAGMLQQGSAAINALRQILSNQPPSIVVQAVAMAIPEIKDPPAELIEPLIQQLCAEEPDVRNALVAALITYHDHDLPARLRVVASNMQSSQATRLVAVTILNQLADRDSIETLINLLETPDDMVRQTSLNALGQMTGVNFGFEIAQWQRWWQTNRNRRPQEWAAPVITSLKEENRAALEEVKNLRDQLAKAYRKIYYLNQEPDRTKHIIECLAHPVPDVRLVGVELINKLIPLVDRKSIAPDMADALRKLIADPDARVRQQAVPVLADIRNPEDAKLLVESLGTETDPATSQAIVRALGLLHNPAAIPVLLEKLNKGDTPVAAAAAAGLSVLCQKPDRTASAEQLDQIIVALNARMDTASDKVLRQAILDAMARIADERFREEFLTALQSQDFAMRQTAVKAFADLGGQDDAEKILAPQIVDPEAVVREAVCTALAKIGKPSQLPLLLQRCDEQAEQNLAVRRAAEDAAIAIMLRMDRPQLRSQLETLAAVPGQAQALGGVLEKALVQLGQNPDNLLQATFNRALAMTKTAANQKEAAAALWVKVVLAQPTDTAAIDMLAKVLAEVGSPDPIAAAVQRIASDQSGALAAVLAALASEVRSAPSATRHAEAARALRNLDTTTWSQPNQQALRVFIEACSGITAHAPSAAVSPSSKTPPASLPHNATSAR